VGTADRLYEIACETRDVETRLDRLILEHEEHEALRRGVTELVEAIDEDRLTGLLPPLTDRTAGALMALKIFIY
jgi:hypothetical protein